MNEHLKNEFLEILAQLTITERQELWEDLVRDGIIPPALASLLPE